MHARSLDPGLLAKLLDLSPAIVMLIDARLVVRWVNQAASDLLGYDIDAAVGRSLLDFLDPDWDPASFQSIATAMTSQGMRLPMTFAADPPRQWRLEVNPSATDTQEHQRSRWLQPIT